MSEPAATGRGLCGTPVAAMEPDLMNIGLAVTVDPLPVTALVPVLSARRGTWKGLVLPEDFKSSETVVTL